MDYDYFRDCNCDTLGTDWLDAELATAVASLMNDVEAFGLALGESAAFLSSNPTAAQAAMARHAGSTALCKAAATLKASAAGEQSLGTLRFSPALESFTSGVSAQKGHTEVVKDSLAAMGETAVLAVILKSSLRAARTGVVSSVAALMVIIIVIYCFLMG